MRKPRIYIAGPMHGKPGYNYPAFNEAAEKLRCDGWGVENPVDICNRFGCHTDIADSFAARRTLSLYEGHADPGTVGELREKALLAARIIDFEIAVLRTCDAIYLLRGWETSVGARNELLKALESGLQVFQG